jgi:hypothetical protein
LKTAGLSYARRLLAAFAILCFGIAAAADQQRIDWWREARFGMFVHWGLYAIPGRGEWVQWNEQIPVEQYAQLAQQFKPAAFDANTWAGLAKEAGMKYMVFTLRHHDGFAMFDDGANPFTSVNTAVHRDFVGEYVKAARQAGLGVGLYYSPLDWRYPGFFFPDLQRASAEAMREQYHRQMKALLSNYGKIDVLWFDGGEADWLGFGGDWSGAEAGANWVKRPAGKHYKGGFDWGHQQVYEMLRRQQPDILVNGRADMREDFHSREGEWALGAFDNRQPWELCSTIAGAWGYQPGMVPRPLEHYIRLLVNVVGRDGNLLLNVGPGPDGRIDAMKGRFSLPDAERGGFNYAYHFDATLYAAYLRKLALARGARRTEGRVVEVTRRQDGGVRSVRLAAGGELAGDLFIDCSGFGSLLLGQALGEPYVDYSRWLPMDRAWACPCERGEGGGAPLAPYTRATALEGGWAWRIPLQQRTGHGHVFASRYVDEDRARRQLLAQLDGKPLAEPRLLRFTTGHRARFWVGNVVALGLASGFLEPLESTSIFLIQSGLARLMVLLKTGAPPDQAAVDGYNTGAVRQFARIRDFIVLHYCLSGRRDSALWRDMASMALPDTLAYRLHTWREAGTLLVYDEEGFDATSWLAIHAGMGHWPRQADPVLQEWPRGEALAVLRRRRDAIAAVVARMPAHADFLAGMLAEAGPANPLEKNIAHSRAA